MSSIYEEMSPEQQKKAKKMMGQLTHNPLAKSSGAGALSPEAAEKLGNKAKELRKKKMAQVGLPSIKKEEVEEDALEKQVMKPEHRNPKGTPKKVRGGDPRSMKENNYDWRTELEEAHWDPVTKTITDKKRTGSDPEIQKMAKTAASSGPKKRVPLGQGTRNKASEFKPSSKDEAQENKRRWDEYWEGSWKSREQKEEYVSEESDRTGMSKKDTYDLLHNHKYSKKELWDMQKKATANGDHGMASGIYARWKEMNEEVISEREMTTGEMKKEKKLKNKYDESGMKASMIKQYGPEKGKSVYFATIRKQAMENSFDYADVYDYIIEMLVAADFAEDYEAAEVMFEHISDEFTATILEEYIEEKARGTRKKTTVHAYDVDETLFGHGKKGKPNVQVHVKDESGKRVKSLSNQEFNTHKLEKGHSYDFSEFQSAKKFKETSSPNKKVIKDIKRKQARGQNVHLITARSKFDNPSEFQGHLKKHGIDVDKKNIHYTGGMKGGDIGKKKVDVANAVAKQSGAKSIHMYDDAAKVHKAFEKEKKEAPTSKKIKTHMVAPDKKGESRVRSYQATKTEEMTAYEDWKQFINEDSENLNEAPGGQAKFWDSNMGKFVTKVSNTAKSAGEYLAPSPEKSAEPSVRSGVRKPTTGFSHVTSMDKAPKPVTAKPKSMTSDSARGGDAAFRAGGGNAALKPGMSRQQVQAAGMSALRAKPKVGNIPPQEGTGKAGPSDVKPSKVITAKNIAGKEQKVSTNKSYDAKLGGVKTTATYGDKGQRMIRANLGNAGVNQVAKGKAKVGQSYGATLGGVKGTVKYDAKGNRSFQALQKPVAPAKPQKPAK